MMQTAVLDAHCVGHCSHTRPGTPPPVATAPRSLMTHAGPLETPEDEVLCVMDVLEEVGDDVARRCYWDFGDWSDLWRETKHVSNSINLQVRLGEC